MGRGEEGEEGPGVCSLRGHLMELLLRVSTLGYGTGQVLGPGPTFCYGPGRGAGSLELDRGSNPVQPLAVIRTSYQPPSSAEPQSWAICRVEETELP